MTGVSLVLRRGRSACLPGWWVLNGSNGRLGGVNGGSVYHFQTFDAGVIMIILGKSLTGP
jgi:hypothetical protein